MIGIFGTLGQGKTVFAVRLINSLYNKGYKIITNIKLNDKYIKHYLITMDELVNKGKNDTNFFNNKVLFIDEFHLVCESRRSNASINVDFTQNILIQLGKLDCIFIYTSQLLSQVDLRIRLMTKYFYWCKKVDYYGNPIMTDERISKIPIYIDIRRIIVYSETDVQEDYFIFNPEPYFKMYNTREIIKLDRDKYLKS